MFYCEPSLIHQPMAIVSPTGPGGRPTAPARHLQVALVSIQWHRRLGRQTGGEAGTEDGYGRHLWIASRPDATLRGRSELVPSILRPLHTPHTHTHTHTHYTTHTHLSHPLNHSLTHSFIQPHHAPRHTAGDVSHLLVPFSTPFAAEPPPAAALLHEQADGLVMLCNPARPCLRQVHGAGTQESLFNHRITRPLTAQAARRCSLISLDRDTTMYRQCRLISRPARQARHARQARQTASQPRCACRSSLTISLPSMRPRLGVLSGWLCWCLIATAARVARIRRAISSRMLQSVCWATRSPCCATPRCLVRTRNSRVAPSRGPPDPGG